MLKQQLLIVMCGLAIAAEAQTVASWRDPAPHRVSTVTVAEGVNLEVLDWGGTGRNVVLLAGSGNSAHVFDEFAPKLTDRWHVYGLTRRGHGSSGRPQTGYDDQRLADDVFEAITRLNIEQPVLVGHSAAGGEMTTVARQHSDRLGGLVYMDAIGDLEDDPGADAEWMALRQKLPPDISPPPSCAPLDRSTFEVFRTTWACQLGFALPVSELHQLFEDAGGHVGATRMPDWVSRAMGQSQAFRHDYSNIRVPVLALLQVASTTESLLASTRYQPKNNAEREAIDRFVEHTRVMIDRWTSKLTGQVPGARVVNVGPVGHYLFLSDEAEVLRDVRALLADVDRTKQ